MGNYIVKGIAQLPKQVIVRPGLVVSLSRLVSQGLVSDKVFVDWEVV